jgi:signal transduction histidine kinase
VNAITIDRDGKLQKNSPVSTLLKYLTLPAIVEKKSGQFTTAMAHEVRNPLTNINLAVEMLKMELNARDQKTYLDIIMRSSVRINELVNELLKYQNADEIQTEKHSICELLDEVLLMAEDRIMLKNITVRKQYAAYDCQIVLNKSNMKIALTNIIINAIDAMNARNGELNLVTKSIDGRYIICIEDNGCGIRKEDLKYIFKPNYTKKPGGLGLGLATTQEILQLNHVEVSVESVEGEGTQFILSFEKEHPYNLFKNRNGSDF